MSQNQIWISSGFSSGFPSGFLANWIGTQGSFRSHRCYCFALFFPWKFLCSWGVGLSGPHQARHIHKGSCGWLQCTSASLHMPESAKSALVAVPWAELLGWAVGATSKFSRTKQRKTITSLADCDPKISPDSHLVPRIFRRVVGKIGWSKGIGKIPMAIVIHDVIRRHRGWDWWRRGSSKDMRKVRVWGKWAYRRIRVYIHSRNRL